MLLVTQSEETGEPAAFSRPNQRGKVPSLPQV